MPDREKVDKGLACCQYSSKSHCDGCPYVYDGLCGINYCTADLTSDALAMLKEQEPVRAGKKIKAGDVVLDFYQCGHCKNAIRKPWRYCPFCGKAVKWDDSSSEIPNS